LYVGTDHHLKFVYKLYGLSDDDIVLVEEAML